MPNRILKESICTSDSIDVLSWFEEVLFYRLIVNCDDYGRFDGRTVVIKNRLFPLKENVTVKSVGQAVERLATVGLVTLYEFEGKPYLQLPTWENHQTIRAKKSKYPPFDADLKSFAGNCKQMHADVPVIQSESNTESESISESISRSERNAHAQDGNDPLAERFAAFWEAYPKKIGKGAAERIFRKIKPSAALLHNMLDAISTQRRSDQWNRERGQYIPNPATWLSQGRWEDETGGENRALPDLTLDELFGA